MQQLIDRYGLDPARCLFINFEDPRLGDRLRFQTLDELVESFRARHQSAGPLHFFFDEI